MHDWRANIGDIDSLYDVDYIEMMIFLRHQYLLAAKDMMVNADHDGLGLTDDCVRVAMSLDVAIESASSPHRS